MSVSRNVWTVLSLVASLAACAGSTDGGDPMPSPGPTSDPPTSPPPGSTSSAADPPDPTDAIDPAGCDAALECSDACGQQAACADDDDACWGTCDDSCGVVAACAGADMGCTEPPMDCESAFECSDQCAEREGCADDDDACWEMCDEECGLDEECLSTI